MIRAQAIADHEKTTGHTGFRGATDETGRVVCTQCPWQYPPAHAAEPVTDAEVEAAIAELPGAQADRIEALVRAANTRALEGLHQHDSACNDGTLYCPTRDYETNPIGRYVRMVGGPRDGHMIHVESWTTSVAYPIKRLDGSAVTLTMPIELDVDSTPPREVIRWSGPDDDIPTDPEPAMGPIDENSDPGPEPEDPPTEPPLDLKARIANLIDVYFGMQDGNPGLPNAAAAADLTDAIHNVVAAGADYENPRIPGAEMTPGQALAYLLDQPEWGRINRLGMLIERDRRAAACFTMNHEGEIEEARALRIERDRLRAAMVQIARLTAIGEPDSVGQSVIGSISSEALVPE